jgi:hypothetical protein
MDLRPQIFVAMSFDERYNQRFEDVIAPAVRGTSINGAALQPYRVDLSKTGDSILADIIDGIAHCQMVLADVSSVGKDSVTGQAYRNANVMYEVGLALACRQPTEVLLLRDDHDKFLFDVSTIPHMWLDFTDHGKAREQLQSELSARLGLRNSTNDARVQLALAGISNQEARLLRGLAELPANAKWRPTNADNYHNILATIRLLDKGLIKVVGEFEKGYLAYSLTPLGGVVAQVVKATLPQVKSAIVNP